MNVVTAVVLALELAGSIASAADIKVETVLADLHYPRGIASRPNATADKYELYIADSGAGRVIKWSNHDRSTTKDVITGFAATSSANKSRQTGPLTLLFLDPGLLVVGGGTEGGDALARCFELPEEGKVLSAAAPTSIASASKSALAKNSPVACPSMTRTHPNDAIPDAVVLVVRAADGTSSLAKARVQAGVLGQPQPFAFAGPAADFGSPQAVAMSNSGRIVAAGPRPRADRDGGKTDGGRLTFFNPLDGDKELELDLDSSAVVDLAYSPITGNLYAADFSSEGRPGGIYRLEAAGELGKPSCRMVKVADVLRPTALAFAPDGALYVTTLGASDDDGSLQVLTGDL